MISDIDRLLERADAAHKTLDVVAPKLERLKAFEDSVREMLQYEGRCDECRGTGMVLAHCPSYYETDTPDERADAYRAALRKCPKCAKRDEVIANLRSMIEVPR